MPAVVRRVLPLPAPQVWALVTDVRRHSRWVPMTRVEAAGVPRQGEQFRAVTAPWARRGGPGLTDRMVVEQLRPPSPDGPGRAVYRKLGPVLLGSAQLRVLPRGPQACLLEWEEDVHLRGLPRALTAGPLRPVLRAMLRRVVRRAEAELLG